MADPFVRLKAALADRYTMEGELGAGGMATVYLAEDLKHHRKVAVKVLRAELAAVLGPERFLREIETTANLNHPHILPLFDSGDADGLLYYVMPLVEGESLRDRMNRERQLPLDAALQIAREVADALSYAHGHDVIHRDIKPENIFLEAGHAVIADFGIARAVTAAGREQLTETGMAIGTPTYMSPEQCQGAPDIDGRTDIYALGTVLYELLAGEPPYTGPTAHAIIAKRLSEPLPHVSTVREAVPPTVEAAINKALAKAPADRYQTAAQLAAALAPAVALRPDEAAPRKTVPRLAAYGAAAIVPLLVAVWLLSGRLDEGADVGASETPRIVVLPFDNLGSPDDEFFADGMTDEITSRLANISGLRVIARQSAVRYKGSRLSRRQIAAELDVDYVLEGTVRTDRVVGGSGQVRITPRLIRVADEAHVWTQPATVALVPGQIFRVQAEVAERVAGALNVMLSDAEQVSIDVLPPGNLEAYEFYLQGNSHFARRTDEDDALRAVDYYQRATDADPRFVEALAALSKARVWLRWQWRPREALAEARVVLDSAHALAPDRDAVNIAAGYYHYYGERDYTTALEWLQRVEARQPSNAEVAAVIGFILRRQGEWESATGRLERAFALNPKDPTAALVLGQTYGARRQFAAAVRYLDQAIALAPSVWMPYRDKAWVYVHEDHGTARAWAVVRAAAEHTVDPGLMRTMADLHRLDRDYDAGAAIAEVAPAVVVPGERWQMYHHAGRDALAVTWADSARRVYESAVGSRAFYESHAVHARLGAVYAVLGRTADAIREAERAEALLPITDDALEGTTVLWNAARTYVLVGQVEAAIDHLETLVAAPFRLGIPPLDLDPIWDPLRDHARFQDLLATCRC